MAPSVQKAAFSEARLALRRFWVEEPRHSENNLAEMCHLYRRTRQAWERGNGVRARFHREGTARGKRESGALGLVFDTTSALRLLHVEAGQLLPFLVAVEYSPAAAIIVVHLMPRLETATKVVL